jgi:hypothetical protein
MVGWQAWGLFGQSTYNIVKISSFFANGEMHAKVLVLIENGEKKCGRCVGY